MKDKSNGSIWAANLNSENNLFRFIRLNGKRILQYKKFDNKGESIWSSYNIKKGEKYSLVFPLQDLNKNYYIMKHQFIKEERQIITKGNVTYVR